MKTTKLLACILIACLALSGCGIYTSTAQEGLPQAPGVSGTNVTASTAGEITPDQVKPADSPVSAGLTKTEAESIALKHAGFSAEQVKGLRSEYDFDDAVAHYDVEFRVGQWEYEYEIHAQTGAVLSVEKDD